jgi:hypothetical protein
MFDWKTFPESARRLVCWRRKALCFPGIEIFACREMIKALGLKDPSIFEKFYVRLDFWYFSSKKST